ncbi:glycosyltransferase [Paenibacillus glycanilyticus]|uniref:glycosyltransferase n=1 Tax=Paenibacillus glycanilyticus TaxID=126569 RepID=UPI003EC0650C
MALLLWTVTVLLVVQLLFVTWNLTGLHPLGGTGEGRKRLDEGREGHKAEDMLPPLLSILIPARNEADNIAVCVKSALSEQSHLIEVIVLDDGSTDGTAEKALLAAAGDARFTLLSGAKLPDDWMGKSFACHQLAAASRGQWLLFLDADARLEPDAVAAALDTALAQEEGLVTGFPYQETRSYMERLIVPLMNFTIACHLPIRLVRSSRDPRFVAAHGAFMLVNSGTYKAIGGHEAFRQHLVDDMQLARSVKTAGHPVTLADISDYVSMRMYKDATGVWNGYKKNLFAGLGRRAPLLLTVLIFYMALYILPPVCLVLYGISLTTGHGAIGDSFVLACVGTLLGFLIKTIIDHRGRFPMRYALLLMPGMLALAGIALSSWLASVRGKGYEWKGRRYS